MTVEIRQGDARAVLATLPAQSVHCCITSPPYYNLRQYGGGPQEIGAEDTPAAYVAHLVEVFRAVHRVLRDDGLLWLVIGDSFANTGGHTCQGATSQRAGRSNVAAQHAVKGTVPAGLKPKDLMMIPHRVALALQADGWYVRQELVWSKPAPMPESVTDRCTRSHEFVFMLAKQPAYYYDAAAIAEAATHAGQRVALGAKSLSRGQAAGAAVRPSGNGLADSIRVAPQRNKRSVWTINTQALNEPHYAAFPEALITPMVLAGTSEAGCCPRCAAPYRRVVERADRAKDRPTGRPWAMGIATQDNWASGTPTHSGLRNDHYRVAQARGWAAGCSCDAGSPLACTTLDPFLGSGTTALVSKRLGRSCIGIELNPAYAEMARRRVASVPYALFSGASGTGGAAR